MASEQNILHLGEKEGRYLVMVLLDNDWYKGIELFRPPSMDTTKEDTSKFSTTGMLEGMTLEADLYPLYPIGDNETIADPRLDIEVLLDQKEIFYGLKSRHNNSTWPLPEPSVLEIICSQHKKAELFLERLMSRTFGREEEARKPRAKELLEKVINFDTGSYKQFSIKRGK